MKQRLLLLFTALFFLIVIPAEAASRPRAFSLISPEASATITTSQPTFQWQPASGATRYTVQIRNKRGTVISRRNYTPAQANCASGTCSAVSPYRFPTGTFSWRVVASNRAGNTAARFQSLTVQIPVNGSVAQQVLTLVNAQRCAAGLVPLALESRLTNAAQGHSTRMAQLNFFSHNDHYNGSTMVTRVNATDYPWRALAENIAAGQTTAQAVFNAWWNSSGHRRNMMNSIYREMGLGYATGGTYGHYWTMSVGTRSGAIGGVCP